MSAGCRDVRLVEALRDGRLAAHDRTSVERHIATCTVCRDAARSLDDVAERLRADAPEPPSSFEHQHARRALLRKASAGDSIPPPRARPLAFALVAAIALVVGWFGGTRAHRPVIAVAAHLHVHAPPAVTAAVVHPSADARLERVVTERSDTLTVSAGAIDVVAPPVSARRLVVRMDDAELELRAAVCRIEAEAGRIRAVAVYEGSVELAYAGTRAVIASGSSWHAAETTAPAPPATAIASASLGAPRRGPAIAKPRPAASASAPPSTEAASARDEVTAIEPAPTAASASNEFGAAVGAVGLGDYDTAVARLRTFAQAHPNDERVDEADYLTAIAFERSGKHADAVTAAQRYLASHPAGAHRREAVQIARAPR